MVLSLLWVVTLTAPLVALLLSTGCAGPVPGAVSEVSFIATAPKATELVPRDTAGQYWKRGQSREIKLGPAGIVSIIERAGPPDEELTRGRRIAITEFSVEFVDVQIPNPFVHPTLIKDSPARRCGPAGHRAGRRWRRLTATSGADPINTARLHEVFERILRESGLVIVPRRTSPFARATRS